MLGRCNEVLPPFYSVKSGLYNARRSTQPTLPKTREELNIPENLAQTISGKNFLLFHLRSEGIICFGTEDNLKLLCGSEEMYLDGTFNVSPALFLQLFTIHAFIQGKQFPLIYALLPNKAAATYVRLFRALKDLSAEKEIALTPKVHLHTTTKYKLMHYIENLI